MEYEPYSPPMMLLCNALSNSSKVIVEQYSAMVYYSTMQFHAILLNNPVPQFIVEQCHGASAG